MTPPVARDCDLDWAIEELRRVYGLTSRVETIAMVREHAEHYTPPTRKQWELVKKAFKDLFEETTA